MKPYRGQRGRAPHAPADAMHKKCKITKKYYYYTFITIAMCGVVLLCAYSNTIAIVVYEVDTYVVVIRT